MTFLYSRHTSLQTSYQQAEEVFTATRLLVLTGPSGSGKSHLAQTMHQKMAPSGQTFLIHDLASLTEGRFESQLYGHVKGAFSDANRAYAGLVGATEEGTLCLEGLEDLSLDGQARLLRFVQERTYRPLGATQERSFPGRLVFTSRFSLSHLKEKGWIREDLYFRLLGTELQLPSLQARKADVIAISHALIEDIQRDLKIEARIPSDDELQGLSLNKLTGNLHGLRNLLQQAMIRGESPQALLSQTAVDPQLNEIQLPDTGTLKQDLHTLERRLILRAMRQDGITREDLAKKLGISIRSLMYKLKEHGL